MNPITVEEYAVAHTTEEPALLRDMQREAYLKTPYPRMISGHLQGMLLRMISKMIRPGRILEIGAFTGYSAICLAEGLAPDGYLHTIEVNPEMKAMLEENLSASEMASKIILHYGDAISVIPMLAETWDLVFIDADKEQYCDYYRLVFDKVRSGGIILADNVLWGGKVLGSGKEDDKETRGIRAFNTMVKEDDRVEQLLLPLRDGLMLIRKR